MQDNNGSKRLGYLEAARGVASLIVVLHHFSLGFFPSIKSTISHGGLHKTPLYVFINGSGAVIFFFVLSGFVLTLRFYQNYSGIELLRAAVKRLPRLMAPAAASITIGATILIYLPTYYISAAAITGSNWLATFANAKMPESFEPSFADATYRSLMVFLMPGFFQYNSNLWTMYFEFYGSMLVFLFALIFGLMKNNTAVMVSAHLAAVALFRVLHAWNFTPFVIGSLISYAYCKRPSLFRLNSPSIAVLSVISIFGYSFENGNAAMAASASLMVLLLGVPSLERKLGGKLGFLLGRLSFPLYLVHALVLVSATSAAYVCLTSLGLSRYVVLLICFAATWVVSIIAAVPFMRLEAVWVPKLNAISKKIVRSPKPTSSQV